MNPGSLLVINLFSRFFTCTTLEFKYIPLSVPDENKSRNYLKVCFFVLLLLIFSPYFTDNVISENHWGGVDIRHGGDPVIVQNIICNGLSDGVVIGEKGKGSIENNVISGKEPELL